VLSTGEWVELPEKASRFMEKLFLDRSANVKPFSFTISVPAK
jgi:hypothetical protein